LTLVEPFVQDLELFERGLEGEQVGGKDVCNFAPDEDLCNEVYGLASYVLEPCCGQRHSEKTSLPRDIDGRIGALHHIPDSPLFVSQGRERTKYHLLECQSSFFYELLDRRCHVAPE